MANQHLRSARELLTGKAWGFARENSVRQELLRYLKEKLSVPGEVGAEPRYLVGPTATMIFNEWRNELDVIEMALESDRESIGQILPICTGEFPSSMQSGLSDPHDKGRTVHILHYVNSPLVLKPRPVWQEQLLSRLSSTIAERLQTDFASAAAVTTDRLGYCQYLPAHRISDIGYNFFFNAGILLLLLEVLGATDCHANNVHILRSGPVLIDCETILHPSFQSAVIAWDQPPDGPLRSELMHTLAPLLQTKHDLYALTSGYAHFWHALAEDFCFRDNLIETINGCAASTTRVVYRATRFYTSIIQELKVEAVASLKFDRARLRKRVIWESCRATDGRVQAIWEAEINALERLDVPRFEMGCDRSTLFADGKPVAEDVIVSPGLAEFNKRVESLSPEALEHKLLIIRLYLDYLQSKRS